ncbi:MAG: GumC family protein [Syntrophobacteraceae bacterium]
MRDFFYILFKFKWLALLLTISCIAAAVGYSYTFLPVYEASSRLLVRIGNEAPPISAGVARPTSVMTMMKPSDIVNSEVEMLKGRGIAEKVVDQLEGELLAVGEEIPKTFWQRVKHWFKSAASYVSEALDRLMVTLNLIVPMSPREKAVAMVQNGVKVEAIQNSNTILVTYRSRNPELAARVVNAVTAVYMRHRMEVQTASDALAFFVNQTDRYKKSMEDAEAKLESYKNKWSIADLEKQRSSLVELMTSMSTDMQKTDAELASLEERVGSAKERLKAKSIAHGDSDLTGASGVVDTLKIKLLDLRAKRMDAALKYSQTDPMVEAIDRQIDDLEKELTKEEAINSMAVQMDALRSRKERLEQYVDASKSDLAKTTQQEQELHRLSRELAQNEDLYKTYFEKMEETRIAQAMDSARISNVVLLEPAFRPTMPVRTIRFIPQKIFNILLATFVGVFLSISIVAAMDFLDHSFRFPEQTEQHLQLPLLGTISDNARLRKALSKDAPPQRGISLPVKENA